MPPCSRRGCTDAILGEHTLDQASAYFFHRGFNGAARDPLHHARVLFTYLRLLGVEPTAGGTLLVTGGDGSFRSQTFELMPDGHGPIETIGPVHLHRRGGAVEGASAIRW